MNLYTHKFSNYDAAKMLVKATKRSVP